MVTLNMPPDLESRLRDEAAREGVEPGTYIVRAIERALHGKPLIASTAQLSVEESDLLGQIGLGLSDADWQRYRELRSKCDGSQLTSAERIELLATSDRIESANPSRMRHLVKLASLRKVPLEQLMDQLGRGNGIEIASGQDSG